MIPPQLTLCLSVFLLVCPSPKMFSKERCFIWNHVITFSTFLTFFTSNRIVFFTTLTVFFFLFYFLLIIILLLLLLLLFSIIL
ncbi:hypothetical protein AB4K20DRAFT_1910427 [Rhizopus microsporus]